MDVAILLSELAPYLSLTRKLADKRRADENRLPRRHRAVPSASLDKSEYLIVSDSLYHSVGRIVNPTYHNPHGFLKIQIADLLYTDASRTERTDALRSVISRTLREASVYPARFFKYFSVACGVYKKRILSSNNEKALQ